MSVCLANVSQDRGHLFIAKNRLESRHNAVAALHAFSNRVSQVFVRASKNATYLGEISGKTFVSQQTLTVVAVTAGAVGTGDAGT